MEQNRYTNKYKKKSSNQDKMNKAKKQIKIKKNKLHETEVENMIRDYYHNSE